ncbi:MAG: sigma-54 dependent transcriptional regulator [Acidobacteriota bacterium]|nr:sigma-54 dependent transcriptional regulator [Acidobacteriota bacterium]
MPKILLLSLEPDHKFEILSRCLEEAGGEALAVGSGAELAASLDQGADGAILTGDGAAGLECMLIAGRLREAGYTCPLVWQTGTVSVDLSMHAMRSGISDIVPTSDGPEALGTAILKLCNNAPEEAAARPRAGTLVGAERVIGQGAAVSVVLDQVSRVAKSEANVLITGESGTGKELTAELIHRNSRRAGRPFVALNCAALPDTLLESELFGYERGAFTGAVATHKGKFEYASEGTLFLDEIGDMSLPSQAKMLRAIEQRVVQRLGSNLDTPARARIISATNQNLEELTRERKFRQDLYFRLNVVRIHLPPLRERREDIPALAEHMLKEVGAQQHEAARRIEHGVIRRLQMHNWPGNIRELRNVIESIVVCSPSRTIGLSDLPMYVRQQLKTSLVPPQDERAKIVHALDSAGGNRGRAAEILHCSRMTLYRKMVRYSIPSGS